MRRPSLSLANPRRRSHNVQLHRQPRSVRVTRTERAKLLSLFARASNATIWRLGGPNGDAERKDVGIDFLPSYPLRALLLPNQRLPTLLLCTVARLRRVETSLLFSTERCLLRINTNLSFLELLLFLPVRLRTGVIIVSPADQRRAITYATDRERSGSPRWRSCLLMLDRCRFRSILSYRSHPKVEAVQLDLCILSSNSLQFAVI